MALSGLEIYKLLPKTNCRECGPPTCLAFAMQLAQKKAELSACPYASEEATSILGAASEPPMRTIKIGTGPFAFEIGGETEMFRHEKTFYHQTAIIIGIEDDWDEDKIRTIVSEADGCVVERVGEKLEIDGFCLNNVSGVGGTFVRTAELVKELTLRPVILCSSDAGAMKEAADLMSGRKPVICSAGDEFEAFVRIARECGGSCVVSGKDFEELAAQTDKIAADGFKDIILNLDSTDSGERLRANTILRRSGLRKGFKPFGYPVISYLKGVNDDELLADAAIGICKYSSIVVLPEYSREMLMTLFTLRQNIYTDPQKPIQVDPKIAAIGEPDETSPVFVTTNFSLTYFIISGEIENAGISAWLVIPDCEGMSVLTAWAAGKFSGEKIAKFAREAGLEEKVTTREIIIPGYVSTISGDLEEALPGWKVVVGPQEASDLAPFLKNYLNH
ncbi:MAG: acetyl-CoA decarbonylase/synthase complex subunit gamma [FCB group bacterium]|nr:acetyl-CoA decarbonylase/synthase complex subunit gamma [FCB group bacterium]